MKEIMLFSLPTPIVKIGDDISEILIRSAEKNAEGFKDGDVLEVGDLNIRGEHFLRFGE